MVLLTPPGPTPSLPSPRVTRVTRAGLVFPVVDAGPLDGSPVVLLHGWPQDATSWDQVSPLLHAAGYRTYAMTLRGAVHSANPRSRVAYRTSLLMADVDALLALIGEPVHLVGHDWGSALAWALAGRGPGVLSLTAVSVPHPLAFARAVATRPAQARASWYMAFFQLPVLPELWLGRPGVLHRFLRASGQSTPAATRDAARLRDRALLRGGLNWYRAMGFASLEGLRTASVPVLQVWSTRDVAVTRAAVDGAQRYARAGYELAILDDASHWIPDEAPEALAALMVPHLGRTTAAAQCTGGVSA